MAKQPGINLNNWTLGHSNDEYSGGSFLYGQNISIGGSKSFKVSERIVNYDITTRNANHIAMIGPYTNNYLMAFSDDGYLESNTTFNENNPSADIGGALYKRTASGGYLNAIKIGDYSIGVTAAKLDVFTGDLFNSSTGIIPSTTIATNPYLTSDTGRTVNAGWTTGPNGAVHSSGVGILSQSLTVTNSAKHRIAIKISGHTTGNVTIAMGGTQLGVITPTNTKTRNMFVRTTASTSEDISFTPTNTFNGTISYVQIQEYVSARVEEEKVSITSATSHPLLYVGGILYIGSGAKIDAVNISDRSVDTYSILDNTHTCFAIHQIGQSFVIFSTNGEDTKISYWDGVSDAPSEVILRKDKIGTSAIVDGTSMYVLCENLYRKELFIASGYDKQPIAIGKRNQYGFGYNKDVYRLDQRNDFYNYSIRTNAMGFYGNKLLIPAYQGLYSYGYDCPGIKPALVKEWSLDCTTPSATASIGGTQYIAYRTTTTSKIGMFRPYEYQYNTTNYLVTTPIVWDNFSTKKQINRFRIGYILPAGTSIDVYIAANKNYFRTFTVSGISVTPLAGAIYRTGEVTTPYNVYEVISTDITGGAGTISCRATQITSSSFEYNTTLTKVSGTGDASITSSDSDTFIKLKSITATTYTQGEDLIFGQEFLSGYMPEWHTIQLKIKLNSSSSIGTPEIFDVPILAEPVGQNG